MANLLTRKQVAELIRKTPGYVGVYVNRKQLVEENKRIDTDNITNKAFISKYITKEVERNNEPEDVGNQNKGKINQGNIDYVSKQHELKLKQLKLQNEELAIKKKKAKVFPVDFGVEMFGIYFKGNVGSILNKGYSLIDKIIDELGGNYPMKLKYKKEFKNMAHKSFKDNHESLTDEIIKKAKEYSIDTKW